MDYADMYQRVKHKACVLGDLSIEGLVRTNEAVLFRELAGLKEASSLEDLKDVLLGATDRLKHLDIFEAVEVRLNAGDTGTDVTKPDTADISIKVREANALKFHAGTYVNQNSEGSLEASIALKNYFGWAERTEASIEYGNQRSNEYCLSYTQPRIMSSYSQMQARLFHSRQNNQRHSSFTEDMTGASVTLTSEDGEHQLALDGGWQEISDHEKTASHSIRQQMGHRVRSCATYTWRKQCLISPDDEGLPYGMAGIKSVTQFGAVAPMAGAVGFAKQVLSGVVMLPLSVASDLTFSAKVGAIVPVGGTFAESESCITDRFFLGGVSSLRGFRTRGIGPTDARRAASALQPTETSDSSQEMQHGGSVVRDALGGDICCSLLAEYNFQVPHPLFQAMDIKGHFFVNGGNVVLLNRDGQVREQMKELANTCRISVGAGLCIPTMMGRFEMNYCRILSSQLHDRPKHGLQFGFMSGFL